MVRLALLLGVVAAAAAWCLGGGSRVTPHGSEGVVRIVLRSGEVVELPAAEVASIDHGARGAGAGALTDCGTEGALAPPSPQRRMATPAWESSDQLVVRVASPLDRIVFDATEVLTQRDDVRAALEPLSESTARRIVAAFREALADDGIELAAEVHESVEAYEAELVERALAEMFLLAENPEAWLAARSPLRRLALRDIGDVPSPRPARRPAD